MMHIALSTRVLAPLRGAGMPGLPLQEEASHSPVPRCVFGFQPSRLHGQCLRPHLGIIEDTPGAEGPLSRRFGDWGLWLCGRANPSHARESWLAHASHLPNIPYLSCLLVLVPCLLLEAPSCSSFVGLSGPQGHFGCKWLPWGVSSASSARNPCRPASCLHADLHSTYSRTAVHYHQQLYELRLYSKDRLADVCSQRPRLIKANKH